MQYFAYFDSFYYIIILNIFSIFINIFIDEIVKTYLLYGDWGLGIGPNPQSPIPNPQSPIPIYILLNSYLKII